MERVDSKFDLVHLSAKRAREINGYFSHLGEGLGSFVPPLLSTDSNKPLSIALEEIAQGKIVGRPIGEADVETDGSSLSIISEDEDNEAS